ncbi:MAG: hypothetical protein KI790_06120 [Cyclobacteriaceae bacterium]|nr:hypothetical protein [Cyclobacteriaceae bacterium HetDA_MAG_MS6]
MKNLIAVIAAICICHLSTGQIRLKQKGEKKANEVLDNLLFGKKKKKNTNTSSTTSDFSPSEPSNYDDSADEGLDYERKPVDFGSLNAEELVHFSVLMDFLPDETNGFKLNRKPDGSMMRTGNFQISTAEKNYLDGKSRDLSIAIYDYKEAATIYSAQASQQYEYESTEGHTKTVDIKEYQAWVSQEYDIDKGTLFLSVNDRFIIMVEGARTTDEELISIAGELDIDQLP